ncbi:AraC family transcriptional regulator [Paenibacillus alvei]|uniref:AraC family transcriptional regulator n=1 Tax=Paenibacillus alvei TaxID=44250 RepID=UPI0018CDFD43|nr:AraC family transcriptional regulator [Paenibacillus alvei]MCY9579054.1 AraC family transcriptional regulator [Paenibacillus alvei]MCY9583482.1 AraC family transcriptional regulator [Paenibacillus alvei]
MTDSPDFQNVQAQSEQITAENDLVKILETYTVASNPTYAEQEGLRVLFAGESQTVPSHKLGPKLYDYYLLHHIMDGQGAFSTETHTYHLKTGDAFLIEPGRLVSYESDAVQPWRYCWIAFQGIHANDLICRAGFSAANPILHAGDQIEVPYQIKQITAAFQEKSVAADLIAHGCLHLILAKYAGMQQHMEEANRLRPESEMQQTVRQAIQMMSTQYAHPMSMEQIAESLGYSRAYFSRIFKRITDMTPVTFLLKLRIDKGRQLLRERPDLTVEQIAASVGIPDALYFSRQFRRFYGHPPTAYRNQVMQPDHTFQRNS